MVLQIEALIGWLLENPEVGWIVTIAYLAWEIRGPKGKIKQIQSSIQSTIVVIRAVARANNEIDAEEVDSYLIDENGSEPGDFLNFNGDGEGSEKISADKGD